MDTVMQAPFVEDRSDEARDKFMASRAGLTLYDAIALTAQNRWRGRRFGRASEGQARIAAGDCVDRLDPSLADYILDVKLKRVTVGSIEKAHIQSAVTSWVAVGMSLSAINTRVSVLTSVGLDTRGCRVRKRRVLKWWLNPEQEDKLVRALVLAGETDMADFIMWQTATGLRIEETLRLTRGAFSVMPDGVSVSVPGTKTAMSQATLPLGSKAASIFHKRFSPDASPAAPLFDVRYHYFMEKWRECRAMLGQGFSRMATLKALRRSAARQFHTNGMPLHFVQEYLRHESMDTTREYLRLTGGYSVHEFRKFLA